MIDQLPQSSLFAGPHLDGCKGLRWVNQEGSLLVPFLVCVTVDLVYEFCVDLFLSPAGPKTAILRNTAHYNNNSLYPSFCSPLLLY